MLTANSSIDAIKWLATRAENDRKALATIARDIWHATDCSYPAAIILAANLVYGSITDTRPPEGTVAQATLLMEVQ